MRTFKLAFVLRTLLAFGVAAAANSASARITVVDGGVIMAVGGYCAPGTAGGADCAPRPLPFSITVAGTTYNSFILNGNGTLTLGNAPLDWNNLPSSFAGYAAPVFSPENDNSIIGRPDLLNPLAGDLDTRWAASVATTPNSLTAYWFNCSTAIFCGKDSLPAILYDGPLTTQQVLDRQTWGMFGLTLTDLGSGFQLDYFYYPNGDPTGTYGFNLPGTASLQTSGPLADRRWIFDSVGQLALPEPGSWLMMLIGFFVLGLALRNERTKLVSAA